MNGFVSQTGPDVVELDVPTGLRIVVPAGGGLACCSGYRNVSDVSGLPGGGSVPQGYVRLRLIKEPTYEWSYVNAAIELRIEVDESLVGKAFPQSRIRAYSGAPNQQREDNWQPLAVTVKALEPVPVLPKRLQRPFATPSRASSSTTTPAACPRLKLGEISALQPFRATAQATPRRSPGAGQHRAGHRSCRSSRRLRGLARSGPA